MITVVINGSSYQYPETNDTDWGNAATQAFADLTAYTLQKKNNGLFDLQNELSFGSDYGIKVLFISTVSNNPAVSGVFRLANNELVAWRNGNNDGDNSISFDNSDNFVINGNTISFDVNGEMLVNGIQVTRSGEIVNADVAANAGIEESKLSLDYSTDSLNTAITTHIARTDNPHNVTKSQVLTGDLIVNTDVDNSAAIVESKLSLDYSTDSLNTAITNHTTDTNNPHSTTIDNLDDTAITSVSSGDTLSYNGSKWINQDNSVDNLTNVNITSIQDKQILSYDNNSSNWINTDNSVSNLSDTTISSPASGQVLTYDGNDSTWKNLPSASASLTGLTDTDISTSPLPSNGDVLAYDSNTTMWVNSGSLTNHIGDTNNPHSTTIDNLDDTTITTVSDKDTLVYDGNNSKWINQENSLDNLSNTDIDSNTVAENDVIVYDDVNQKWINSPILVNHIGNTANPHLTTVAKLTDASITTPADKDLLQYDYANSQWINSNDVWSTIEVNDIAYVGTTPQGHTVDGSNNVTMLSTDNRHQVLTASDGYNIILPSTGIKAGEKFIFDFSSQNGSFTTPIVFYVGANPKVYANTKYFRYEFLALVDNPTTNANWNFAFTPYRTSIEWHGSNDYTVDSANANQRYSNSSSTIIQIPSGVYEGTLCASVLGGTINTANDWFFLARSGDYVITVDDGHRLAIAGVQSFTHSSGTAFDINGYLVYPMQCPPYTAHVECFTNTLRSRSINFLVSFYSSTAGRVKTNTCITMKLIAPLYGSAHTV